MIELQDTMSDLTGRGGDSYRFRGRRENGKEDG